MLTKRQKQILDFIQSYAHKRGYAPSLEDTKKHFRLSSVATVHQHIEALSRKGYLKKQANQPRGIELDLRVVAVNRAGAGEPSVTVTVVL